MEKINYRQLIQRTLQDFDFCKVHNCMEHLGWKWGGETPTIGQLYQEAERLLIEAAQKQCSVACGGFQAYSDSTSVELNFIIAEAGCTIYELEEMEHGED